MALKITAILAALSLAISLMLRLSVWSIFTFELVDFMEFQWLFRTLSLIEMLLSTIPLILFFFVFVFARAGAVAGKAGP